MTLKRPLLAAFGLLIGLALILEGCAPADPPDAPVDEPARVRVGSWAGDLFFTRGHDSLDPVTGEQPEELPNQVRQALDNLGATLGGVSLGYSHVVKVNVYLTSPDDLEDMNAVYRQYFPKEPPARTTVVVPGLPGGARVGVTAVAGRSENRRRIHPEGVLPARGDIFPPAVEIDDFVFLSGQGSLHYRTGEPPEGDFEEHVRRTLENLQAVLRAAGLDLSHVVKSNVYLTDFTLFSRMNAAYIPFFEADPPARTTVGVRDLPGGSPIGITFTAVRTDTTPREIVSPTGVERRAAFSPAVRFAPLLFPSGKAGTVDGGVGPQTREIMDDLREALQAGGLDFRHVVEAKAYLTDPGRYLELRRVFDTYFEDVVAPLTVVGVSDLPGETAEVEITLLAAEEH